MRLRFGAAGLVLVAVLGLFAARARSAEDEAMARWQAAMTPGAEHEFLASWVGRWTVTTKMWMAGPDQPPAESTGECEITSALGGRFIRELTTATMMGMPFESLTMIGYDNIKKKYVASHYDSTSTGIVAMEGYRHPDTGEIALWGVMDEPMTGERDKPLKFVYRQPDADTIVMEVHDMVLPTAATRVVEVTFIRA